MTAESVLRLADLAFDYGSRPLLRDLDLSVGRGEVVCILGPSGSGKSTLLRLIAGLERPSRGRIEIAGRCVADTRSSEPAERRGVGMVFQDDALFPHLSVIDNVGFGLIGLPRRERRPRALEALDRLGLSDRADDWPHRLSGGEQQRVAVARALAPRPGLILMDEPFSRLDSQLRYRVRDDALSALRASGASVIFVTHDAEEAMASADSLVLMANGRILQFGTPEDCYRRPVSVEAGQLLGPLNVLPVDVMNESARTPFGTLDLPGVASGPARLVFRPEALRAAADGVTASVAARQFGGACMRLEVEAGGFRARMAVQGRNGGDGDTIRVRLEAGEVEVLPG